MNQRDKVMGRRAASSGIGEVLTDIDEQVVKYANIPKRANAILKKLGVPAPRRPNMDSTPMLEGPVSEMTDAELGDVQGAFAVWESYFSRIAADAESQVDVRKAVRDYLLSELKKNAVGPQTGRADKAKTDPRYIDADAEYLVAKKVLTEVRAALGGQETQRKVCSRYVEIRRMEFESHTRTHNVQNMQHERQGTPRFRRTPEPKEE